MECRRVGPGKLSSQLVSMRVGDARRVAARFVSSFAGRRRTPDQASAARARVAGGEKIPKNPFGLGQKPVDGELAQDPGPSRGAQGRSQAGVAGKLQQAARSPVRMKASSSPRARI